MGARVLINDGWYKAYFDERLSMASNLSSLATAGFDRGMLKEAAFLLHQSLERAYSCVLLTLTNYAPPSHNIKFLRSLAEEQDRRLADAFPRDEYQPRARFNTLNEAYVKARYSKHYAISEEALAWLSERTSNLLGAVNATCTEYLEQLRLDVERGAVGWNGALGTKDEIAHSRKPVALRLERGRNQIAVSQQH